MAKIVPDGWNAVAVLGAAQREIETLARLAEGLPDSYTVYHSVHWTTVHRGTSLYGEIDFIVVNRAGHLLCIEQKSGFLDETSEGLVKRYPGKTKSVSVQISRSLAGLQDRLVGALKAARLEYLLYCPDYRVKHPGSAGIAPERIIDAARRDDLLKAIRSALPEGEDAPLARDAHRFLRDILQLETDVSALLGGARSTVTRISGGLALWARQLEFEPFRLRVHGTAGSGKTQLALAEYRAALAAGRRPLYVCFNRPLADHFAAIVPQGGLACTFHGLCERLVRSSGASPDLSAPGSLETLVVQAADIEPAEALRFDVLIVDEGQDFDETWRDMVLRHAKDGARVLWLEDPLQNLYGRPPVALPGWVTMRAVANYRSPRAVVRLLRALAPDAGIEAASPFDAFEVDFLTYQSAAELLQGTKEAIRQCFSAGFRKEDVAIVSFRGRDASTLAHYDRLGSNTLRFFTGKHDLLGHPIYSEGDLLLESVYRFKGQSAPAVILAEVDFEQLDEKTIRKLFVGATRAMMKLVIVLSEGAAAKLYARLSGIA